MHSMWHWLAVTVHRFTAFSMDQIFISSWFQQIWSIENQNRFLVKSNLLFCNYYVWCSEEFYLFYGKYIFYVFYPFSNYYYKLFACRYILLYINCINFPENKCEEKHYHSKQGVRTKNPNSLFKGIRALLEVNRNLAAMLGWSAYTKLLIASLCVSSNQFEKISQDLLKKYKRVRKGKEVFLWSHILEWGGR